MGNMLEPESNAIGELGVHRLHNGTSQALINARPIYFAKGNGLTYVLSVEVCRTCERNVA